MENNITSDRAGENSIGQGREIEKKETRPENIEKEIIRQYFSGLQKKSALSRKKNDSETYKKMARLRWEKEEDLNIITE